ncbi:lyase family protein [Paucibacter sp. AS339]|uniref:lyase family protein n=1 Tax=Paucibacter hankyongi TaxID=3133434 RepID=UPI003094CDEE
MLVLEGFLSTPEMHRLFEANSVVQAMMDFEAALARAQGRVGLIPTAAAQAIASLCRVELYDVPALVAGGSVSGNPAGSLVRKLAETVALFDPNAAACVHLGASSQDLVDSSMVLLTRRALVLIEDDLLSLIASLLDQADAYPQTPLLARTLMQATQVSSLRFRLLAWSMPLLRSAQALRKTADQALLLQFGGTVGTLSALEGCADAVTEALARELNLPAPSMCWHTQRDGVVRLGSELGILCGSLGKLARDLALLSQSELGELQPSGCEAAVGKSSQRSASAGMQAMAASLRAPQRVAAMLACMSQEHERGLGNWQAELAELEGLLLHTHGAVRGVRDALAVLGFCPARMLANIEAQRGMVFADALAQLLAGVIGRQEAYQQVDLLGGRVRRGEGLLSVLARQLIQQDARLASAIDESTLRRVFDQGLAAQQADARVAKACLESREALNGLLARPHW